MVLNVKTIMVSDSEIMYSTIEASNSRYTIVPTFESSTPTSIYTTTSSLFAVVAASDTTSTIMEDIIADNDLQIKTNSRAIETGKARCVAKEMD